MKLLLILVPAYNEETSIISVLADIKKHRARKVRTDILVIDDGSTDDTYSLCIKNKVKVVRHLLNRGLGAALGTGFIYAVKNLYDFVVTIDADGQHRAADIPRLLRPLQKGNADVVIGSRLLRRGQMPVLRRAINWLSNIFTLLLFNIWTTDSQSGLRAFTRHAFTGFRIRSQHMEVSSEILKEIKRLNLRLVEIPIQPIYTQYSLKKGQRIANATQIIWKLVLNHLL